MKTKVIGYLANNGKVYTRKSDRTKANNKQFKNQIANLAEQKGWKLGKL